MYIVRRTLVWLRRMRHSRGFGVQSPWAYRFVRYVVNEHYPYYSYATLDDRWKASGKRERKLGRLYFRIANFLQPSTAIDYSASHELFADYVRSGCRRTEVLHISPQMTERQIREAMKGINEVQLMRIVPEGDYRAVLRMAAEKAGERSLIVVEGINRDKEMKDFWKETVASDEYLTTFDLYYCGIIFFNRKRYKENYVVNF